MTHSSWSQNEILVNGTALNSWVSYEESSLFLWAKGVTSYHPSVFLLWWHITWEQQSEWWWMWFCLRGQKSHAGDVDRYMGCIIDTTLARWYSLVFCRISHKNISVRKMVHGPCKIICTSIQSAGGTKTRCPKQKQRWEWTLMRQVVIYTKHSGLQHTAVCFCWGLITSFVGFRYFCLCGSLLLYLSFYLSVSMYNI